MENYIVQDHSRLQPVITGCVRFKLFKFSENRNRNRLKVDKNRRLWFGLFWSGPARFRVFSGCVSRTFKHYDCQVTGAEKIPQFEASFRAICGSILGQPPRRAAQINYVTATGDDEFAWLNGGSTGLQGNGEGPSAI